MCEEASFAVCTGLVRSCSAGHLLPSLFPLNVLHAGHVQVSHTPSRNRQWHMYSTMERKNMHSISLKRVFLRWGTPLGAGTQRSDDTLLAQLAQV